MPSSIPRSWRRMASCGSPRRKEFSIAMKEADINQAVRQIIGKPLKIKVTIGEVAAQNQEKVAAAPPRRKTMCRAARSRIRKCRAFGICSAERSARFAT